MLPNFTSFYDVAWFYLMAFWDRKERYIEQMRQASADVHLVSLADKLDNLRSTQALLQQEGATAWQRFKGDRDQSL